MAEPPPELVQQLYSTPPDRFVAARDVAAADARRAGDPATARQIARLRRPTVAAWLVNLLAIRRPELVADLVRLADALRSAQRELRGPRLRELSGQRRAVVAALVVEARRLAAGESGAPSAGKLPLAEVEATLNAALSDTGVAEQIQAGRLLRAASYAGFGEVPRPQLRLVTGDEEEEERPARRDTGRAQAPRVPGGDRAAHRAAQAEREAQTERARQRRALERELTKARTAQERAESELADAAQAERDGVAALDDIENELAELERRRAVAEQELSRAKLARRGAERALTAARRRTGEAEAAAEALDAEEGAAGRGGGEAG